MLELRKALLPGGFCLLLSLPVQGEPVDSASRLRELMTQQQYLAAGLDKLTDAERDALYEWLLTQPDRVGVQTVVEPVTSPAPAVSVDVETATIATPPPKPLAQETQPTPQNTTKNSAANSANFGFSEPPRQRAQEPGKLYAKVLPPFRGWEGKTIFYLDNGQVWRQRSSGKHTYTGVDTRVAISKNRFGFYEMRLLDADRSVGVKRIK